MADLLQQISEIPAQRLIPVACLLVCGLVLWIAGRRVMRYIFPVAGLLIGGIMGLAIGSSGQLGVDEPYIVAGVGAIVVAVVAGLAYRLAIAGALGVLLAAAAPMAVWTAAHQGLLTFEGQQPLFAPETGETGDVADAGGDRGTSGVSTQLPPDVEQWLDELFEPAEEPPQPPVLASDGASAAGAEDIGDDIMDAGRDVARPIVVAADLARNAWADSPPSMKGSLLAAGATGGMLGFVVGAAAPSFTAIVVSALGGSFLLLSTSWLLGARFAPGSSLLEQSPTTWTVLWLVVALIGLGVQWFFRPKKTRTAAPAEE